MRRVRGGCCRGNSSGASPNAAPEGVGAVCDTDAKPPRLEEMARTIPFAELAGVFDDFSNAKINRRIVVDLSE